MALANAVQGARRPSQQITWARADGIAEDLTGAELTGLIHSPSTGLTRAIAGTLSVTDAEAGIFTWSYATADVADAGTFDVQFQAAFGTAPTPAKTFMAQWVVKPGLTASS